MVDAAAVAANFEMMTRLADGTGAAMPEERLERSAFAIETMGIERPHQPALTTVSACGPDTYMARVEQLVDDCISRGVGATRVAVATRVVGTIGPTDTPGSGAHSGRGWSLRGVDRSTRPAGPEAHPDARVDLPEGPRLVTGRAACGEERERLWSRWREIDKNLDAYATRRSTETAVVVLEPRP